MWRKPVCLGGELHATVRTGQTGRLPCQEGPLQLSVGVWGKNISNGVSEELSFLANHLIMGLHNLWIPSGASGYVPPQGLIQTFKNFYSFLNPFYILAITTCCSSVIPCCLTFWVRRCLLLVAWLLAWPSPIAWSRVNSLHMRYYDPMGISCTFFFLPPHNFSPSRSWGIPEPLLLPYSPLPKKSWSSSNQMGSTRGTESQNVSRQFLNTSSEGDFTDSLDVLFQCVVTAQ